MHWTDDYIGKEWEPAGRGPDAFDCWGLVVEVLQRYGIQMPDTFVGIDWQDIAMDWRHVAEPSDGCVALMRRPGDTHVGLFVGVNGGRILHCIEGVGVTLADREFFRLQGWQIRYYENVRQRHLH